MAKVTKARVVLKGSLTYTVGKMKWIKGVPKILEGKVVQKYLNNGYFSCTPMKSEKSDSEYQPEAKVLRKKSKKKAKKKLRK